VFAPPGPTPAPAEPLARAPTAPPAPSTRAPLNTCPYRQLPYAIACTLAPPARRRAALPTAAAALFHTNVASAARRTACVVASPARSAPTRRPHLLTSPPLQCLLASASAPVPGRLLPRAPLLRAHKPAPGANRAAQRARHALSERLSRPRLPPPGPACAAPVLAPAASPALASSPRRTHLSRLRRWLWPRRALRLAPHSLLPSPTRTLGAAARPPALRTALAQAPAKPHARAWELACRSPCARTRSGPSLPAWAAPAPRLGRPPLTAPALPRPAPPLALAGRTPLDPDHALPHAPGPARPASGRLRPALPAAASRCLPALACTWAQPSRAPARACAHRAAAAVAEPT
jgi:hypothetical protein